MGLSFSSPLSRWNEFFRHIVLSVTDEVETVIARSVSFGSKDGEEMLRALSFNTNQGLENRDHLNEKVPTSTNEHEFFTSPRPMSELDDAATKVQKVYKSYRTRRNLADCAVVVEELWWKTLDSAALNHSSISFFNNYDHETATSRWNRASRRAARVGKGLAQDDKAQKLALHHWLEAIDPRHRYGRNLRFYFDEWSAMRSCQPFFFWLDIGHGKEVNLPSCPRVDLQRQCIQYLGPKERDAYEVIVEEGKLVYKQSESLLNTNGTSKWIFVLSTSRVLYVGEKKKGVFQHSSFLSGGVISAAGRLIAHNGILEAIWPHSGHYLPTEYNFKEFVCFLDCHRVNLTNVKIRSTHDDEAEAGAEDFDFQTSGVIPSKSEIGNRPAEAKAHKHHLPINTANIHAPKLNITKSSSRKWSSGVGPRIECIRDYPLELQSQALEKVSLSSLSTNLSPRYSKCDAPIPSPRPSRRIRVSPNLSNLGLPLPSPRAALSTPNPPEV